MKKAEEKFNNQINNIKPRAITEEMEESYIDYAMSVIVSRALPDVRDGLKPVQRRILYTMYEMGLKHNAKFRKSATITGTTLGRYHPHGDAPVYGALARMAQDFSLRYPLVHGQGNWGCFTKDTKIKLCNGKSLSFEKLINEQKKGKRHWTFSFNHKTQKIEMAEIKNPRLTRKNERIIQVILDNGEKIKCTLDHRFLMRNGTYKMAKGLKPGDSLMPLYIKLYKGEDKNLKEYEMVFQPKHNKWDFAHRLADKWNLKNKIYRRNAGRIRHHKDFNKYNNNPDNILRIQWKDHWGLHKEIASWRHQNDLEYVKKLARGRQRFIENNKEVFSQRAKNLNKKLWASSDFRKKYSEKIKEMWQNPEYRKFMRELSSKNLKKLWEREDFQKLLSKLKSEEMKRRWQNEEYRNRKIQEMRKFSLKMWQSPRHREKMSELMKKRWADPIQREKQSKISKKLWEDLEFRRKVCNGIRRNWQNPEHRAKYEKDYFRKMGMKAWENPEFRIRQREKAAKQWMNPAFRTKIAKLVSIRNKKRLKEDPEMVKRMTEKARISLQKKWQDSNYKRRVIKSKVLGYVYSLSKKYPKVTTEIYKKERTNNGVPKLENALNYFDNFSEILSEAPKYNHKVVNTRILRKKENVYDLTVKLWHNFALDAGIFVHNSVDGDEPAAQRYTEAKLSKIGEETLKDVEKDTVDFLANFDGTRQEPIVLPSPLPQLLLNGCLGIAVGMATNIPPHNVSETCEAAIYLLDHPNADTSDLFEFIKGPDFPTGGIIYNKKAILSAYSQGRGSIQTRGKAEIVKTKFGFRIVISEIPYGVQKSKIIQQIAKLIQDKKFREVRDIRDESDKDGLRVVLDLRQGSQPQRALNFLYRWTLLQTSFHLNMVALVDGIQPRLLGLAEILQYFLLHRQEVIRRRTKFDLDRAKERSHILEGFEKALKNIDAVIKTIKNSKDRADAEKGLIKKFKLTKIQANAILDMKLANLAKLERQKILDELKQVKAKIKELSSILKSPQKIKEIIKKELEAYKKEYGDQRKTKIVSYQVGEMSFEDLVPDEPAIITLTQKGFIKRVKPSVLRIQKRGGKGMIGQKTIGEDVVEHLVFSQTHDKLLFFTDSGKVFQTIVYEVPEAKRVARGKSVFNFLDISTEEKVLALLALKKKEKEEGSSYFVMATKKGIIKKTAASEFGNVRRPGLIAIKLKKQDLLKSVQKTKGDDEIMFITRKGKAIRFPEKNARPMGRAAAGVKGIGLAKGDEVIGMEIIKAKSKGQKAKGRNKEIDYLLVVSENGYGKMTLISEYRAQKRGGRGIKTAKITKKTGDLIAAKMINGSENYLIAISQKGNVIRMPITGISKTGRDTQGVRLMRLDKQDKVASIAVI